MGGTLNFDPAALAKAAAMATILDGNCHVILTPFVHTESSTPCISSITFQHRSYFLVVNRGIQVN